MRVHFYLRFHTEFGQSLCISGNTDELGNNEISGALLMTYLNDDFWTATNEVKSKKLNHLNYKYILKTKECDVIPEAGHDRDATIEKNEAHELVFVDDWNHAGEYENAFYTSPFQKT